MRSALRADGRRPPEGRPRSVLDTIVATIADANGCTMVTDNEKDFAGVPVTNRVRGRS